jgi:magnesium-transporting ATPase (P-type)
LKRVTRTIAVLAAGIGGMFFVLAMLFTGIEWSDSFIFAMGMIVAFVPEGMLPTVTVALAMGVQRMARRNALLKRLSAVETLGCTTVICTDKTGTLTENQMTVSAIWVEGRRLTVTGAGYSSDGEILEQGHALDLANEDGLKAFLWRQAAAATRGLRDLKTEQIVGRWLAIPWRRRWALLRSRQGSRGDGRRSRPSSR